MSRVRLKMSNSDIPARSIIVLSGTKLRLMKVRSSSGSYSTLASGWPQTLEAAEIGHEAKRHHGQRFGAEIAEIEPVGPYHVEVLIEPPHFGNGIEFLRVVVPAIDKELESAHHRRKLRSRW